MSQHKINLSPGDRIRANVVLMGQMGVEYV